MKSPDIEVRWDLSVSNWKRHHRRHVLPPILSALGVATNGLAAAGIGSNIREVLLSRAHSHTPYWAATDRTGGVEIFVKASDVQHRKVARHHNIWAQMIFHEGVHAARYAHFTGQSILESAVHEGLAYCGAQLFGAQAGFNYRDEVGEPIDFVRQHSNKFHRDIEKEVFDGHVRLGELGEEGFAKGSEELELVREPLTNVYSRTDFVGIHAVSGLIDQGYSISDLITMPAEEILGFETAA